MSGSLLSSFLVLLMLTVLVTNVRSQQEVHRTRDASQRGIPPTVVVPKNELEKVVSRYCLYAFRGQFLELKRLVSAGASLGGSVSKTSAEGGETASLDIVALAAKTNLEKHIPDMLAAGHFYISEITTASQGAKKGAVKVVLQSSLNSGNQVSIIFELARSRKAGWKIFEAYYDLPDDHRTKDLP